MIDSPRLLGKILNAMGFGTLLLLSGGDRWVHPRGYQVEDNDLEGEAIREIRRMRDEINRLTARVLELEEDAVTDEDHEKAERVAMEFEMEEDRRLRDIPPDYHVRFPGQETEE